MTNSAEDYIYVIEDAKGNEQAIDRGERGRTDALKRLEEGTGFKMKIYRLWRVYEEKKP